MNLLRMFQNFEELSRGITKLEQMNWSNTFRMLNASIAGTEFIN